MKKQTKQPVILFGIGATAELAHYYLREDSPYQVAAFTVDRAFCKSSTFDGKPVIPFEDLEKHLPAKRYACLFPIGPQRMNRLREERYRMAKSRGYKFVSYVSSKATRWTNVQIGENAFILEDNTLQPFSRIGNNVVLWSGNHIGHHSVIEDHCFIASQAVICGHVRVGSFSFVGVNATIRECVKVGQANLVGAGALILRNTANNAVYAEAETAVSRVTSQRVPL